MSNYKNCVYRFVNNKREIIYIGKALNLENRINTTGHIRKHLHAECYDEIALIQYLEFKTQNDMDFAERYFIQKYNPKYNSMNSDKPITFEISELDKRLWSVFYLDEKEVLRQIEAFKSKYLAENGGNYIKIKIDAKLLDFVKVFSLYENITFKSYNKYHYFRCYEEPGNSEEFQITEKDIKSYKNINVLEDLLNTDKDIIRKIRQALNSIFNEYRLLDFHFRYPVQQYKNVYDKKLDIMMNMIDFNYLIDLPNNSFTISFLANGCVNTCSHWDCDAIFCSRRGKCRSKKYRIECNLEVECN